MMGQLSQFVSDNWYLGYFALITGFAVFLFWRSVQRTCCRKEEYDPDLINPEDIERSKREWGRKAIDFLILSFGTALVFGRALYIFYQPDSFADARWFWIPYERIEGEVFLFSSFPWLFLRVWDGGVLLSGIVLGWYISTLVYSRMMNIRWGAVSNAVADFLWFLFLGVEAYYIYRYGSIQFYIIIAYYLLLGAARWIANSNKIRMKTFHRSVSFVWKVSIMVGIPGIMLSSAMLSRDDARWYLLAGAAGLTVLIGLWVLAGDALEFFKILSPRRGSGAEKAGGVGDGKGSAADPASRPGDWRRFVNKEPGLRKSGDQSPGRRGLPRDFSRSYRDYSSGLLGSLSVIWARLRKKRDSDGEAE